MAVRVPFDENKHPRGRGGRFVDVIARMTAMGGTYDQSTKTWTVPDSQAAQLDQLFADLGITPVVDAPGSAPADPVPSVPDGPDAATADAPNAVSPEGTWAHPDAPPDAPETSAAAPETSAERRGAIPPRMRPATPEERRTAGIPRGYPEAFVPEEGERNGMIGVGVDSKGRVKRFYSADFQNGQAIAKFERIRRLAPELPKLDERLVPDARTNDDAAATLLIRATGMRPGSTRDTGADKQAFGATTLLTHHVQLEGDRATLVFTGKGGKPLKIAVTDPDTVAMLQDRVAAQPGDSPLFRTDGKKVAAYIKDAVGDDFKVKDLRTAMGTSIALQMVASLSTPDTKKEATALRKQVAERVSAQLGNTPAEALKSYIDPQVFAGWP